jgi:HNH endonuclease
MRSKRQPLNKVLDYGLTPVSQSTVRRAYTTWRNVQGLTIRCDNPECHLHTVNLIWNGRPIAMILDHVDGNRKNNLPSNLRLMCPNCDSQLATRGGGNKGRIRNATPDSYHIVERTGQYEVKTMPTGCSTTTNAGNVGIKIEKI